MTGSISQAQSESPHPRITLADVLITEQLKHRGGNTPDYHLENQALVDVIEALTSNPRTILQRLVDAALRLCEPATTAGISLIDQGDQGQTVFVWPAVTGNLASELVDSIPRDDSPCGIVVDRNGPQLLREPGRYYPRLASIDPPIAETLLLPFHVDGKAVGTLWIITQDPTVRFTDEHRRRLSSLTSVAGLAYQRQITCSQLEKSLKAQRQTDSALRALNNTLKQRVAERTAEREAANKLLRQREAQLRRMDRLGLINALATGIGHELNQPLSAIRTYAEGCANRLDREELANVDWLAEGLSRIAEQAARSGRIINRLRELTRLQEPSWTCLNVETLADEVVELARAKAQEAGVDLRVEVDADLPRIVGGRTELQQVLLNLIINAIQAIEEHECNPPRRVTIQAQASDAGVDISVRDTGPGANDQQMAQMFDPLYTTKTHGTGMGLNLCEQIVAHHDGRLGVKRNTDRGLTVTLHLRRKPTGSVGEVETE